MACVFCRGKFPLLLRDAPHELCTCSRCPFCHSLGRKLKCDGRSTCANCHKRGILCTYVPV